MTKVLQLYNYLSMYFAVSNSNYLRAGTMLKCGEDIVVHRGEHKTLKFWSADDDLLKVQVVPSNGIKKRYYPSERPALYNRIPGLSEAILAHSKYAGQYATKTNRRPSEGLHYAGNPDIDISELSRYENETGYHEDDMREEIKINESMGDYEILTQTNSEKTSSSSTTVPSTTPQKFLTSSITTIPSTTTQSIKLVTFFPNLDNRETSTESNKQNTLTKETNTNILHDGVSADNLPNIDDIMKENFETKSDIIQGESATVATPNQDDINIMNSINLIRESDQENEFYRAEEIELSGDVEDVTTITTLPDVMDESDLPDDENVEYEDEEEHSEDMEDNTTTTLPNVMNESDVQYEDEKVYSDVMEDSTTTILPDIVDESDVDDENKQYEDEEEYSDDMEDNTTAISSDIIDEGDAPDDENMQYEEKETHSDDELTSTDSTTESSSDINDLKSSTILEDKDYDEKNDIEDGITLIPDNTKKTYELEHIDINNDQTTRIDNDYRTRSNINDRVVGPDELTYNTDVTVDEVTTLPDYDFEISEALLGDSINQMEIAMRTFSYKNVGTTATTEIESEGTDLNVTEPGEVYENIKTVHMAGHQKIIDTQSNEGVESEFSGPDENVDYEETKASIPKIDIFDPSSDSSSIDDLTQQRVQVVLPEAIEKNVNKPPTVQQHSDDYEETKASIPIVKESNKDAISINVEDIKQDRLQTTNIETYTVNNTNSDSNVNIETLVDISNNDADITTTEFYKSETADNFKGYDYYEALYDSLMPQDNSKDHSNTLRVEQDGGLHEGITHTKFDDFDTETKYDSADYETTKDSIPHHRPLNAVVANEVLNIQQERVKTTNLDAESNVKALDDEIIDGMEVTESITFDDFITTISDKGEFDDTVTENVGHADEIYIEMQNNSSDTLNVIRDNLNSKSTNTLHEFDQVEEDMSNSTKEEEEYAEESTTVAANQLPLDGELHDEGEDSNDEVRSTILNSIASIIRNTLNTAYSTSSFELEDTQDAEISATDPSILNILDPVNEVTENDVNEEFIQIPLIIVDGNIKVSQNRDAASIAVPISALETEDTLNEYLNSKLQTGSHLLIKQNGSQVSVNSLSELTEEIYKDDIDNIIKKNNHKTGVQNIDSPTTPSHKVTKVNDHASENEDKLVINLSSDFIQDLSNGQSTTKIEIESSTIISLNELNTEAVKAEENTTLYTTSTVKEGHIDNDAPARESTVPAFDSSSSLSPTDSTIEEMTESSLDRSPQNSVLSILEEIILNEVRLDKEKAEIDDLIEQSTDNIIKQQSTGKISNDMNQNSNATMSTASEIVTDKAIREIQERNPARKDDSGHQFGGEPPFFIKLPGSPNAVPLFIEYEPVQVKYISPETREGSIPLLENERRLDSTKFASRTGIENEIDAIETNLLINDTMQSMLTTIFPQNLKEIHTQITSTLKPSTGLDEITDIFSSNTDNEIMQLDKSKPQPKSPNESSHAHIPIPISFLKKQSSHSDSRDPFIVMHAPDLASQEVATPDEPFFDLYAHSKQPHLKTQQVSSHLSVSNEADNIIMGEKYDDIEVPEVMSPGEYYSSEHRGTIYGDVDLERLNNPVFKLQTKMTRPTAEELMNPAYTPFPITTNPPREKVTTTPSSTENTISTSNNRFSTTLASKNIQQRTTIQKFTPTQSPNRVVQESILQNDIFGADVIERIRSTEPSSASYLEPQSVEYSPIPEVDFRIPHDSNNAPKFLKKSPNAFPSWYPKSENNENSFRAAALTSSDLSEHKHGGVAVDNVRDFQGFKPSPPDIHPKKASARYTGSTQSKEVILLY